MKTKLQLPRGTTGFWNDKNEWFCTGSQMGRRDVLPASTHPKLRLERLRFVDGCYDRAGAYWGRMESRLSNQINSEQGQPCVAGPFRSH